MEDSVLFPLEKTRVKPGTVLIETVLSGDSLYHKKDISQYLEKRLYVFLGCVAIP